MTKYQRALQIWPLLVCAARDRRTYTYREVADVLGMPKGWRAIGHFLDPIFLYCEEKRLPPLWALVVRKDTGIPGYGPTNPEEVERERERAFVHDWSAEKTPGTADFEQADRK